MKKLAALLTILSLSIAGVGICGCGGDDGAPAGGGPQDTAPPAGLDDGPAGPPDGGGEPGLD